MPEGTDFAIKVTSDDPKQKKTEDKKEDTKTGSSKATDDVKKDGEGEELVSSGFIGNGYVLMICID
jgi:hypothetical protein